MACLINTKEVEDIKREVTGGSEVMARAILKVKHYQVTGEVIKDSDPFVHDVSIDEARLIKSNIEKNQYNTLLVHGTGAKIKSIKKDLNALGDVRSMFELDQIEAAGNRSIVTSLNEELKRVNNTIRSVQNKATLDPAQKIGLSKRLEELKDRKNRILNIMKVLSDTNDFESVWAQGLAALNNIEKELATVDEGGVINEDKLDSINSQFELWRHVFDMSIDNKFFDPMVLAIDTIKNEIQNSTSTKITRIADKINNFHDRYLTEQVQKYVSGVIDPKDVTRVLTDIGPLRRNFMDIGRTNDPVMQALAHIIAVTNAEQNNEYQKRVSKFRALVAKALPILKKFQKDNGWETPWELFFQTRKTRVGDKYTGNYVHSYDQQFWDNNSVDYLNYKNEQSDIIRQKLPDSVMNKKLADLQEKYRQKRRKHTVTIDVSKLLYKEYFTGNNPVKIYGVPDFAFTDQEILDYEKELEAQIGANELQRAKKNLKRTIDEYLGERSFNMTKDEEKYTGAETEAELKLKHPYVRNDGTNIYIITQENWSKFVLDDIYHSPFNYSIYMNRNVKSRWNGKVAGLSGGKAMRHVSIPIRYNPDGTETGLYDKKYDKIQENEDLKNLHDFITELGIEAHTLMPDNLKKQISYNFIYGMNKTFYEFVRDTKGWRLLPKHAIEIIKEGKRRLGDELAKMLRTEKDGVINEQNYRSASAHFITNNREQVNEIVSRQVTLKKQELLEDGVPLDKIEKELATLRKDLEAEIADNIFRKRSQDLEKVVPMFMSMLFTYKHRSEVMPMINLMEHRINTLYGVTDKSKVAKKKNDKPVAKGGQLATAGQNDALEHLDLTLTKFEDRQYVPKYITDPYRTDMFKSFNSRLFTNDENEKINELKKIIENNKALFDAGKIPEADYIEAQFHANKELTEMMFTYHPAQNLLYKGMTSVIRTVALSFNFPGHIRNRIEGIHRAHSVAADGRSFDVPSFWKAVKMLNVTPDSLKGLGVSLGTWAGIVALPFGVGILASAAISIGGGLVGYLGARAFAKFFKSSAPHFSKMINILIANNIEVAGESEVNISERGSSDEEKRRFMKPETLQNLSEMLNATTIILSSLLYNKVKVNGVESSLYDIMGEDGLVNVTDNIEWGNKTYTPDELRKELAYSLPYLLSMKTGQYSKSLPLGLERYAWSRPLMMFQRWRYEYLFGWLGDETIKQYGLKNYRARQNPLNGDPVVGEYQENRPMLQTVMNSLGSVVPSVAAGYMMAMPLYLATSILVPVSIPFFLPLGITTVASHMYSRRKYMKATGNKSEWFDPKIIDSIIALFPYSALNLVGAKNRKKRFLDSLPEPDKANIQSLQVSLSWFATTWLMLQAMDAILRSSRDDDEEDDVVRKALKTAAYITRGAQQNIFGFIDPKSLWEDYGKNGGTGVTTRFLENLGKFLAYSPGILEDILPGEIELDDSTMKWARYERSNKASKVEAGDYKYKVYFNRMFPFITKLDSQYRQLAREPKKKEE